MLDTVSSDRIRHELELVLQEEMPEKVLRRADKLGVLEKLFPGLKGDSWLNKKFAASREAISPDTTSPEIYLALLAFRLSEEETEEFIREYRLRKSQAKNLRDITNLKTSLDELAKNDIKRSKIYRILHDSSKSALTAFSIAADSPAVKEHIDFYLNELRYVKPNLNGKDLERLGYEPGPRMKQILDFLLEAKLDGVETTKEQDETMILGW